MNNSKPSTGSICLSKVETSDFMSFSGTQASPNVNKFSPNCYSSPQNQKWSPKGYNNYRGRNKNNRFSNQSFSPNRSYNSNSSFNNSYTSPNYNYSYNNKNKNRGDKTLNKSSFLHPSFMEDPWAHLEQQLRQRHSQTNTSNAFVDEQTDSKFVSDSNTKNVSGEEITP